MKNVKLMLMILALVGTFSIAQAQKTVVRVYPKHGTVVKTVNKPRVVVHNKTNFYFSDGVWYRAQGRNYVVAAAPVGVKVRRLPRTRSVVVVNGRKLYKYRGVWYRKTGRNYVVVNV
ncbi:MAG: DUF6515 family protein [Bacteroidota bacterium]